MPFTLPFETEIRALEEQLAALSPGSAEHADLRARLEAREREVYTNLSAHETFLLSGHPLRPKALDYVTHIFRNVKLLDNPDVRGDHLLIGGEGQIEISGQLIDVIIIGQQTGPTSNGAELTRLPSSEYRRWNQGMSYPDSYRKAVYLMNIAEQRGWPVVVLVDTPGADPSEYSEEEGQAFAINEVIHKTTALRVPSLSYIISLGASGGAIAITPTNRTIMNEYATYMVISPGGCASILFRKRDPESIRKAATGLRLTSRDALQQDTVDEVVEEGPHPGHRYPRELLAKAKIAVTRNIAQLLGIPEGQAESVRRARFFAMGVWGTSDEQRTPETLAGMAAEQARVFSEVRAALADFMVKEGGKRDGNGRAVDREALARGIESRLRVARMVYAIAQRDRRYLQDVLGQDVRALSKIQWARLHDFVLARRYGHRTGAASLHPNGGTRAYRRLHPVDWIRQLSDTATFREFEETIRYCSVDQLAFPQYDVALRRGFEKTKLKSGLITGTARIDGHAAVLAINNFGLVGSSLCDEIGEKFRYAAGQALKNRIPLISVAMGGGARMQEGTPSMHRNIPKVQHSLNELEEAGVPHISIIADPTLGGTAISYGLRGDYMIVVRGSANIGFSGRRVVEQFQRRKVSRDFQSGMWLLRRGYVDEVVATEDMGKRLAELLGYVADGGRLSDLQTRQTRRWEPTRETLLEATTERPGQGARTARAGRSAPIAAQPHMFKPITDAGGSGNWDGCLPSQRIRSSR